MDRKTLVKKLREALEETKGIDVELEVSDSVGTANALTVTNLHVGFKGSGGNKFICLSSLWTSIAAIGDDAEARTLDFFGAPRTEVVLGGRVDDQLFNIIIRPQ